MNLYGRTFGFLKPYWKQLVSASLSAGLHALLSGALVWLCGPLLMTLFQVGSIPVVMSDPTEIQQPAEPGNLSSDPADIVEDVGSWITTTRESMKGWVDQIVTGAAFQNGERCIGDVRVITVL